MPVQNAPYLVHNACFPLLDGCFQSLDGCFPLLDACFLSFNDSYPLLDACFRSLDDSYPFFDGLLLLIGQIGLGDAIWRVFQDDDWFPFWDCI